MFEQITGDWGRGGEGQRRVLFHVCFPMSPFPLCTVSMYYLFEDSLSQVW